MCLYKPILGLYSNYLTICVDTCDLHAGLVVGAQVNDKGPVQRKEDIEGDWDDEFEPGHAILDVLVGEVVVAELAVLEDFKRSNNSESDINRMNWVKF